MSDDDAFPLAADDPFLLAADDVVPRAADGRPIVPGTGEPMDPDMDPDRDLRAYPQDPEGRQPDETSDDWWGRTGRVWNGRGRG